MKITFDLAKRLLERGKGSIQGVAIKYIEPPRNDNRFAPGTRYEVNGEFCFTITEAANCLVELLNKDTQ